MLLWAAGWSFNLTLYNWWAAGGPPVPHPEIYEHRGNVFLVVSVLLFVAFVAVTVMNVRRSKRHT